MAGDEGHSGEPEEQEDDAWRGGLIRFLRRGPSREELATALAVFEEFKACECLLEMTPTLAWLRLEQFEDYLRLLTREGVEG